MPSKCEKTINECFKEFFIHCKAKNLSKRTMSYYEECFYRFANYYGENNLIEDVDQAVVDSFINYLKSTTNCSNTSINTFLRGIRSLLYYCMDKKYLEAFKITLTKSEKKIKDTYTDDELKRILKKPNLKKCNFSEYRNWVVVNYLMATGNRLDTIINIKIKHVDFESGNILLDKTKNKKQQVIPMSTSLQKVLVEYINNRSAKNEDDYLFCNIYGSKLTASALKNAIRRYNLARGVNKTSIHLFRHTFSKKWILAGGDIFRLQKILGHASIDMVKEYVNIFSRDLYKDFDRFNPLDQIIQRKEYIRVRE